MVYDEQINVEKINKDIAMFESVFPITEDMVKSFDGISRMIMLDRYSFKDTEKESLTKGDLVILTIQDDPTYPVKGLGFVKEILHDKGSVLINVMEEYKGSLSPGDMDEEYVERTIASIDKPLEFYFEQIAKRNAKGLSAVEKTKELEEEFNQKFYEELSNMRLIPAGRVLYGAGTESDVTYFNCYVMPYPKDSRGGLSKHREEAMEIMSRGGGVGTNGSTLRPRDTLARGVNGKSSGSVSWLDDLSQLTHLVQQGGSRRGAQMLLLADSHPDIIEFIISKMQNPKILQFIANTSKDEQISRTAEDKLKFIPLTNREAEMYEGIISVNKRVKNASFSEETIQGAKEMLSDGGTYEVHNPESLTGANISVAVSDDFMHAVEHDLMWDLKFPDVENYSEEEMKVYNETWHEIGDVREWEELGHKVKTYRQIKAKDLWQLINTCATYAAEPGIFFIDRANEETNAKAYGQKVVATNPCGEQPLAPYSVCNLAAINLAEMVNKETKEVDYEQLKETVRNTVRFQDNVIDATPYFLEKNKVQALGERRLGLGVMALADLLIYTGHRYGSAEGNKVVNEVFETIAITAYETSIEIAKEKGSFPFLVGKSEVETQSLRKAFISTGYMKKMPKHIHESILKYGIRNSHLLTVAPTGSTGTMAGVGTGLEPYFAFKYFRSGRLGKFIEMNSEIVQEYLTMNPHADENNLPEEFVSAMELTPMEHVSVQNTVQYWIDSSISKTVNAPKGFTVKQVAEVYEELYAGGAKGGTVYVDGSRDTQVLTLGDEDESMREDVMLDKDISMIKMAHTKEVGSDGTIYGTEPGNHCPICRQGIVEVISGCNTCTNCNAQLTCGL